MRTFNEDTRVKIPATFQFLRLGYEYQSLDDSDIDCNTKIFINRFKPALEKINGRSFDMLEITEIISDIHALIRNNDMGRAFYNRLTDSAAEVKLIDFDDIYANDFAVVDELPYTVERDTAEGSFRPDINILINGMPLGFLEVKKPNNDGGIQEEFKRMIDSRLQNPAYRKFFNLIQFVSFSNNMEYEETDDASAEMIKAGSFYTTPSGSSTSFSFFREDDPGYIADYPYKNLGEDRCREIIKDLGYDPRVFDTEEFQTADDVMTPCNRFVTSVFDKERFLFFIKYGLLYVNGKVPQKHIMRYPQFFAVRRILKRLEEGEKRGIIWHTQGSGKTELAAYANKAIRDYYAKQDTVTRFFFVVDRLELLRQDMDEFSNRYFNAVQCNSKKEFSEELARPLSKSKVEGTDGEFVVVNIQKFESAMPKARNEYNTNVQRVFFIDEAHRSYALNGEYFKNLILCDPDAVFIALTGTPLLTKKERSNLKFGDYIHKYFYDKSIADGYTLRIKKEKIDTVVRKEIHENIHFEEDEAPEKSDVYESDQFVADIGRYIEKDFRNFRTINHDTSIGGMIVCRSNPQAQRMYEWFRDNSDLTAGLVMSNESDPKQAEANKNNQKSFKYDGCPDLLIVHYMLTTGYDVSRLKKMYLLRGPKAQNLLQTISRVNRPYKAPNGKVYKYGYITDFVDIEEEYDRTINDYLAELEKDINDVDDEGGSLNGLVVDVDTILSNYNKANEEFTDIIDVDDLEKYSRKLTYFNKSVLLQIKHLLNTMKDCYVELLLSNAMNEADKINVELIKKKLRTTQERIDFINLSESPVSMMDVFSDEEVIEIVYEFLLANVSIIDLFKFDPSNASYQKFTKTLRDVQAEIKKNKNKDDIRIIYLNEALKKLFAKLDITDIEELDGLDEEMRAILEEAIEINKENERLAKIYDGNFALVRTYQDAMVKRPDLSNKEIEAAIKIIYNEIKDIIGLETLVVQGREGFIDETKKKVVKPLLKSKLYKQLGLKNWIDSLLSELYTNLQSYR
ncbi:DEAD/DEAH box helicase family protein [Bifidobacterium magnum]|uniref:type I site-specific deoxyribonuclease n=1 Tax=Bifidobacterium magnum TaxID=1692 RepID=A0A087B9U2_9BIFI|nr:DEAD/DEAH box helicase family protein [Bifidobacterium magnum]KFI67792.1 putative Type I restriction (R) subunit of unknown recognition sequence [Bifidobacterium magnum]